MTKTTNTTNRIKTLETVLGYDENGQRNGNGIITLIEKIDKQQTEISQRYDILKNDIDNIELRLNQINDNWKSLSFDIKTLNENIKNVEWRFSSFENQMKEHSEIMNDVVTSNKLRNIAKDFGLLVATIMGLGTLFAAISYIYNKINGR